VYAAASAVHDAQWERVDACLQLARTLIARDDLDANGGSVGPDGTKRSAMAVALKAHGKHLDCREACKGQGEACDCGVPAGAELVALLDARGAAVDADAAEQVPRRERSPGAGGRAAAAAERAHDHRGASASLRR
jgi:hypothetical protein